MAATLLHDFDVSSIELGKYNKERKSAFINTKDDGGSGRGSCPFIQLTTAEKPMRTPFGVSKYDQKSAGRHSLPLDVTAEQAGFVRAIEDRIIKLVIENKETFFKKKSEADIRAQFTSNIKEHEEYGLRLNTKINAIEGMPNSAKVGLLTKEQTWDPREALDIGANARLVPICKVQNIWIQNLQWGVLFLTTYVALMPGPEEVEFPFVGFAPKRKQAEKEEEKEEEEPDKKRRKVEKEEEREKEEEEEEEENELLKGLMKQQ